MEKTLYGVYRLVGASCYLILHFLLPVFSYLGEKYNYGLRQRLGRYDSAISTPQGETIWIHASSVGEVKVAATIIETLAGEFPALHFVVTTTTAQGKKLAEKITPAGTLCVMAPLDIKGPVSKAIQLIQPSIYICIETELWPVMLKQVKEHTDNLLLLNGRLSERSHSRYLYVKSLVSELLQSFLHIAAISKKDAARFISLGAAADVVTTCGNIKTSKYNGGARVAAQNYQKLLKLTGEKVFITGSTHPGEEKQLFEVFKSLSLTNSFIWVLAPRHIERVTEICDWLTKNNEPFDLFSLLKSGTNRKQRIVLVDTMGDLSTLYSAGDYNFCGGSLVPKGGHNILEPVQMAKPVFYGPNMQDFAEIAGDVKSAGCGFEVQNPSELVDRLLYFEEHPQEYNAACAKAVEFNNKQNQAMQQQVALVRAILKNNRESEKDNS